MSDSFDLRGPHNIAGAAPGTGSSRLTMPTSSSLAKQRPPVHSIFPRAGSGVGSGKAIAQMHLPRRRQWGDGTELEDIEDLRVDDESPRAHRLAQKCELHGPSASARSGTGPNLASAAMERMSSRDKSEKSESSHSKETGSEKRKKSGSKRTRTRKPAGLIKNLGPVDKAKGKRRNPTSLSRV